MPLGPGTNISNIGFHAPPQEPGWANDGTFNNQGYSSQPWTVTQASGSITWNSETFAQNQNANAIRWGTLYNFRFDADQPPQSVNATVGYFKTGAPMSVQIQAPGVGTTPTPTPTATATANTYIYTHSNSHAYSNSNGYCNCNSYAYRDTGADHAHCARLQGAGAAEGGPLLEWSYLEQHRHLS